MSTAQAVKSTDPKELLKKYGIILVLVFLIVLFSITAPIFLKVDNLLNITRQVAMMGIAAVGMTFVILSGGIDLSIGSLMAMINILCAKLMVSGVHPVAAVIFGLLAGIIVGAINAFWVTRMEIPPLIATLGMMTVLKGVAYLLCNGYPIYGFTENFRILGQGYVGIIPIPVIIMAVIFILGWIFLNKTRYGRYIYGTGGNEEAARLSGISTTRIKFMVYILCGFITGIASIIMLSRVNTGQPNVGTGLEMEVITAIVLGGVSIAGGQGKLLGVFIGILIMGVLSNGMIILNISEFYQLITRGLVLLLAVSFDNMSKKKKDR